MSKITKLDLINQLFQIITEVHVNLEHKIIPSDGIVTPLQFTALSYLFTHPGATVGALGKRMHLSSPAIAQLGDRLVAAKLVKRAQQISDRRAVLLFLTPKGKKVFEEFNCQKEKTLNKILEYMTEADLKKLVELFNNLLKQIGK